jgi:hypothetical protein
MAETIFEFYVALPMISKKYQRESLDAATLAFLRLILYDRPYQCEEVWANKRGKYADCVLGVKVTKPVKLFLTNYSEDLPRGWPSNYYITESLELSYPYAINKTHIFELSFRDENGKYISQDDNSIISVKWGFVNQRVNLYTEIIEPIYRRVREELLQTIDKVD